MGLWAPDVDRRLGAGVVAVANIPSDAALVRGLKSLFRGFCMECLP
jgi:hypothetical protein